MVSAAVNLLMQVLWIAGLTNGTVCEYLLLREIPCKSPLALLAVKQKCGNDLRGVENGEQDMANCGVCSGAA